MKKIFFITLGVVILATVGWIFLFPSKSAPVIDQVQEYLPFGSGDNLPAPENTDAGSFGEYSTEDHAATDARSRVFQISKEPIAGAKIITSTSTVFVRYAERATGHIYDFDLYTLEKRRVTNQTIPKVYEAIFNSNGNKVLYRMLSESGTLQENISLALTPPKNTSSSTEEFYSISSTILRKDIGDLIASNDTLYYVLQDDSSVVSSNFEGKNLKVLYTSPFDNWRLDLSGNSLILWTKSSSNSDGYAYKLNLANLSLQKILGPIEGLSLNVSPTKEEMVYSINTDGKTRSVLSGIPIFEGFEFLPATLAEKCAWANKNTVIYCGVPTTQLSPREPDDWYKGISQYSDNVWSFNGEYEESKLIAELSKIAGTEIEVMNPQISPSDDYLLFTNRKDLSLWALRIE